MKASESLPNSNSGESALFIEDSCDNIMRLEEHEDSIGLKASFHATLEIQSKKHVERETSKTFSLPNSNHSQCPLTIEVVSIYQPSCFGQNDGSISINVTGGSGNYLYEWQADANCFFFGATTQNIQNADACDYVVIVTDSETGCTASSSIALNSPDILNLSLELSTYVNGFNQSCSDSNDGAISVFVTGGTPDSIAFAPYLYHYEWMSDCGLNALDPTQYGNSPNSPFITNLPEGNYGVMVTDANGCLATTCFDLIAPSPIQSLPNIQDITCAEDNGCIESNIQGGTNNFISYEWSENAGTNTMNSPNICGLEAGIYTLTVTDSNGCVETFDYELSNLPEVSIELQTTSTTCFNTCDGSVSIDVSGGLPPFALNLDGAPLEETFSGSITNLCPGVHQLTIFDSSGCMSDTTFIIDSPEAITVMTEISSFDINENYNLNCNGDSDGAINSTIFGGSAPYTLSWQDESGLELSNTEDINSLTAGFYCLTVFDSDGCAVESCVTISEPATPLEITANFSQFNSEFNLNCFNSSDGFIDLTTFGGTPPYSYQWSGNGTIENAEDQVNLSQGEFTVMISDSNNCSASFAFSLIAPQPISVTTEITNPSCHEICDAQITSMISGISDNTEISWNGPNGFFSNNSNISNLCSGSYTLNIIDLSSNCSIQQIHIIENPEALSLSITLSEYNIDGSIYNISSPGGNDGSVLLEIENGTPDFIYNWSPDFISNTNANPSGLTAGEYSIEVIDANGCTLDTILTLSEPSSQCDGNRYLNAVFPEYSFTSDIQYGSNTNYLGSQVQLAMDVYEPAGDLLSARPLIIVCHGGFFLSGDKAAPDVVPFCEDLARKGYVVASINYRMGVALSFTGLDNRFSQAVLRAVQDLNAAIRWFRKNAAEDGNTFRIDPNNIFTFGTSAGGFMVLQHAYMDDDEIPTSVDQSAPGLTGGVLGNSGNPGFPSDARALISNCGAMGDNAWIDADENIPACLFHGDSDLVVPIDSAMFTLAGFYPVAITEGSIPIHEKLEMLGIENCFEISENAGHVPYLTNSAIYDTTLSIMTGFLAHFVCGIELNCSYQEFNTGTDEREMDSGFILYPNPVSGEITIAGLMPGATWRILNYEGKIIGTHTERSARVDDLASGMYLIEILTEESKTVRERIVIMH